MSCEFSILILTLNEEKNLPGCLDSVKWCDDVHILDSLSRDRTTEIALERGAHVAQRSFDNFAEQRNYALDHIPFRYPWIFHLDADERFTDPLRRECEATILKQDHSGYLVPSKMMFMGRWLRFAGMYPSYQMRLLKRGEVRFAQAGHGQREGETKRGVGTLREPYLHYSFSKGLDDWFTRHNSYSSQEALAGRNRSQIAGTSWRGAFSMDPVRRRRAVKGLALFFPCRPLARFLYMFLIRGGFLDGLPGYHYCRLLTIYEYMISIKMREARLRQKGLAL